jgi:type VI secretion system secreted protein VgrG
VKITAAEAAAPADKARTVIDMTHASLKLASKDPNQADKATIELSVSGPPEKGTIELKTTANQFLKLDETAKKASMQAGANYSMVIDETAKTAELLATSFSLKLDEQGKKGTLGEATWKVEVTNKGAEMKGNGVGVAARPSFARLYKDSSQVQVEAAQIQVKTTDVKINGKNSVKVLANGKIMLG